MTELRPQIFFFLKSKGPSTVEEITRNLPDHPEAEVSVELGNLVKDGLLKRDSESKFHICLYIDAPIIEFRKDGLYNYQTIQEKIPIDPAQSRPPVWINENVYAIPQRDQGERGTCVGQATAYAADLNAIKLTDWRPDLKAIRRNSIVDIGKVKFIKDDLPLGCASAECSFITSREIGGIRKDQLGSFLDYSIKAWNKQGICTDMLWWNPKSANYDNYDAHPTSRKKSASQAELHVIDGYAAVKDFESIKDAIYKNGFVLMAINVFENWTDNNCEGIFPDPKGNMIGSHALCWVGYDENNLYCLHSWEGWSLLGGISKTYFDKAHCTAFVPLDAHETSVAKEHYCKLIVTTDVQCNIVIGTDTFKKTKRATGAFDPGTTVKITAIPSLLGAPVQEKEVTLNQDVEVPFVFMTTCSASFHDIMARIKSYLEALWK